MNFRKWQQKFYNSKQWKNLRDEIRETKKMRCKVCGKLIKGKSIVDHIIEITPYNKEDEEITLNPNNLRLMCIECHNKKTFKGRSIKRKRKKINYDLDNREDVNLF